MRLHRPLAVDGEARSALPYGRRRIAHTVASIAMSATSRATERLPTTQTQVIELAWLGPHHSAVRHRWSGGYVSHAQSMAVEGGESVSLPNADKRNEHKKGGRVCSDE